MPRLPQQNVKSIEGTKQFNLALPISIRNRLAAASMTSEIPMKVLILEAIVEKLDRLEQADVCRK